MVKAVVKHGKFHVKGSEPAKKGDIVEVSEATLKNLGNTLERVIEAVIAEVKEEVVEAAETVIKAVKEAPAVKAGVKPAAVKPATK